MSAKGPHLGIDFAFDDNGEESRVAPLDRPSQEDGADGEQEPWEPLPAIKAARRTGRLPGPAEAAEVERLLDAVGLRPAEDAEVTLITQDGIRLAVLPERAVVIGRSDEDAQLIVAEPTISRRHCRVTREVDGRVTVEDLSSANGTWVHRGTQRLDVEAGRSTLLQHGDWIRSGAEVALAYVSVGPPADEDPR